MNRTALLTSIAILIVAGGATAQTRDRAIEGYYPEIDPPSTMTRAQVVADVEAARATGALGFAHDGELAAYPDAVGGEKPPIQFASDRDAAN